MLSLIGEKPCQNHAARLVRSGIQPVTKHAEYRMSDMYITRCRDYGTGYVYNNPQHQALNSRQRLLIQYALYLYIMLIIINNSTADNSRTNGTGRRLI